MFTGIIASTGQLIKREPHCLTLQGGRLTRMLKSGSSIAVDGVCLTVTKKENSKITVDVMPETLRTTNLKTKKPGDLVNLEPAMKADGRFDGHFVTGHIDGTGKVTALQKKGSSHLVTLQIPKSLTRYVIPKGSIALNGVSLTVIEVKKGKVSVGLIPHTFRHTNFQTLKVGDKINVETDILAKYLRK